MIHKSNGKTSGSRLKHCRDDRQLRQAKPKPLDRGLQHTAMTPKRRKAKAKPLDRGLNIAAMTGNCDKQNQNRWIADEQHTAMTPKRRKAKAKTAGSRITAYRDDGAVNGTD